jgi:hypothetical protein
VRAAWRLLGRASYLTLRALLAVARVVATVDRAFRATVGGAVTAVATAFAQALARTHRGTAQDMTLLDLAGLALLLVGRLFGS